MNLKEKTFKVLKSVSGVEINREEDHLLEDLALDSLKMVLLLVELEEAFEISLDESDMNPFDLITVGDVVRLAEKYCGDEYE